MNRFTKLPKTGDAVVGELATGQVRFIPLEELDYDRLDQSAYETIGTVAFRHGNRVLVVYKENASKVFCNTVDYLLTGYLLDGEEHTSTLQLKLTTSSDTLTDIAVTYAATTQQAMIDQLNTVLSAHETAPTWRWTAYAVGEQIYLCADFKFYQQANGCKGADGFALEARTMEGVPYCNVALKQNGTYNSDTLTANMDRRIYYLRSLAPSLTADITSTAKNTAVALQDWLGNSPDGLDHCAYLRSVYGEGEEGWIRCLEANRAVMPTDRGALRYGHDYAMQLTDRLCELRNCFGDLKHPALNYVRTVVNSVCLPPERWHLISLPDGLELTSMLRYGTDPSRLSDPINECLYRLKGAAISNGAGRWFAARSALHAAWYCDGTYGYAGYHGSMYNALQVLPASSLTI